MVFRTLPGTPKAKAWASEPSRDAPPGMLRAVNAATLSGPPPRIINLLLDNSPDGNALEDLGGNDLQLE